MYGAVNDINRILENINYDDDKRKFEIRLNELKSKKNEYDDQQLQESLQSLKQTSNKFLSLFGLSTDNFQINNDGSVTTK